MGWLQLRKYSFWAIYVAVAFAIAYVGFGFVNNFTLSNYAKIAGLVFGAIGVIGLLGYGVGRLFADAPANQ
jgi:hypothetical protein